MSEEGDSSPEIEFKPFWGLALTSGFSCLLGFGGMLFSTIMAYEPFQLEFFLDLTNMELGGISLAVCLISAGVFCMAYFSEEEEQFFGALAKFITGVGLCGLFLISLVYYLIQPIEEAYSGGFDGGSYTLLNWLLYGFVAVILFLAVLGLLIGEREE